MSGSENSGKEFELACEGCGEKNPPHFAICWNCGQSLENAQRVEAVDEANLDDDVTETTSSTENPFGHWTGWCELGAVLLVTFVNRMVDLIVYRDSNAPAPRHSDAILYLTYLPWYIGVSTLLWIFIRRDKAIVQPVALKKCKWSNEFWFAIAIVFANWLVVRMARAIAYGVGVSHERSSGSSIEGAQEWLIYAAIWFFATLYEEILFRVYLQSKIELLIGRPTIAILISASIFAVSHGYPLLGTIQVFAMGVLFGSIYYCSRRLPRLALAHWMYDLLIAVVQNH